MEGDVPNSTVPVSGHRCGRPESGCSGSQHLIDPLGGHLGRREHHDNHDHHNGHDDVGGVGAEHHDKMSLKAASRAAVSAAGTAFTMEAPTQ